MFRANEDKYVVVDSADDILRAKKEGKLAVGFHFQGRTPSLRTSIWSIRITGSAFATC